MPTLPDRFERYIVERRLFQSGSRILVAVSGGVDSMTLLDLISRIGPSWNLTLAVVHVHHGIRGREADADEAFVQESSRRAGLPYHSCRVNAVRHAEEHRISLEAAARDLRRGFFRAVLSETGFDAVATAHNADDWAETVLMHLFRGAGINGIVGIRPVRGWIVRPLLFAGRLDIETYAAQKHIQYRNDATNLDRQFLRNWIRLDVLGPVKKRLGESVISTICRAGEAAFDVQEWLEHEAESAFNRAVIRQTASEIVLDIDQFLNYFTAVQKALLVKIFQQVPYVGSGPSRQELLRIVQLARSGKSGARVLPRKTMTVLKSGNRLVFQMLKTEPAALSVEIGKTVEWAEAAVRFASSVVDRRTIASVVHPDSKVAYLDRDTLIPPFELRFSKPGDWFVPLGMQGKKKLHDFFIDEKIPLWRRSKIPLFVAGESIAWVAGMRIDDRYKITNATTTVLTLHLISD